MKSSHIHFDIQLDDNNIPNKILWDASDKQPKGAEETKAFCLSLWDSKYQSTLKIDLWSKDMPLDEMKRFYVETLGGLAESLMSATGDEHMVNEINDLCERLGKYIEKQSQK